MRRILFALVMLAGIFTPIDAHATNCYVVTGTSLTDGSACSGIVTVDSSVTSIASFAFANNHNITTVNLPSTITSLGQSTFEGSWVTSVSLPDSVTSLGNGVFAYTPYLTSIRLSKGLTELPDVAFLGSAISSIVIPSSVTSLRNNVFESSGVVTIWLPNTIASIGNYLLRYDNALTTINYCGTNATILNYPYKTGLSTTCSLPLPAFSLSHSSETATVGTAITSYTITSTGGAIASYSISPDILTTPSNGLGFSATTGVISGTPISVSSPITFTISAINNSGSISRTYAIAVVASVNSQNSSPVPDPLQLSKITSLAPTSGVAGTPTPVTVTGNFIEKISAIQINGVGITAGSWTQTSTSVTFIIPAKSAGSYSVQIYNGSAPVLAQQAFTVTAAPTPVSLNPAPKQKKTYISCAKPGHGTRITYGVNPVCPIGYVKK